MMLINKFGKYFNLFNHDFNSIKFNKKFKSIIYKLKTIILEKLGPEQKFIIKTK